MAIWFINSNESLESILFMVTLKGSSSIKNELDILHGCYATLCMIGYKHNHGSYAFRNNSFNFGMKVALSTQDSSKFKFDMSISKCH